MSEELFRKKVVDKAKSPENLDDYIRLSNPGVWLLLVSVMALLVGALIWGIFGKIDSTTPTTVFVKDKQVVCVVAEKDLPSVQVGLTVEFDDYEAVITEIGGHVENQVGYICTLSMNEMPEDGFYDGEIIVASFRPLSFILN